MISAATERLFWLPVTLDNRLSDDGTETVMKWVVVRRKGLGGVSMERYSVALSGQYFTALFGEAL